jgi:hypothetical protein
MAQIRREGLSPREWQSFDALPNVPSFGLQRPIVRR